MLLLVSVCAICLVISAAFDMDAIDFDLLVENLTIYNGTVLQGSKGNRKLFNVNLFFQKVEPRFPVTATFWTFSSFLPPTISRCG